MKIMSEESISFAELIAIIQKIKMTKVKTLSHKMDKSKVEVLRKIEELNQKHEWVKVQQDAKLIKYDEREFTIQRDAVHAGRLVWFKLLERKDRRSGYYRITEAGKLFLMGMYAVPAKIHVSKGRVIREDPETVTIDQVKDVILDGEYWAGFPHIEKREEISMIRVQQGSLF